MEPPGGRRSYQQIVSGILDDLGRSGVLTDTNPGSVTRTLVEAFGRELAESYAQLGQIYDMGFIESAEGAALDRLVALLGIERVEGAAARGTLVLRRDPRVSGRVFIPEGTEIQFESAAADKRVTYLTDDAGEIPIGAAEMSIGIFAAITDGVEPSDIVLDGADVEHGSLQLTAPIAGVAGSRLAAPTAIRGLRETDEELRERAKGAVEAAGGGTRKALERAVFETGHASTVRLRDATAEEGQPRPGELEVVTDADLSNPQVRRDLERAIQAAKGPGILVHLRAVERRLVTFRLRLKPVNPGLSASQRRSLRQQAEERIGERLERLQLGEGLAWNRWLADLLNIPGVLDIDVAGSSLQLADGEPAIPGDVEVGELERLVLADGPGALVIDVADERTLHVALDLALPATAQDSGGRMQAAVTSAFQEMLDRINGEEEPQHLTLVDMRAALDQAVPSLLLLPEHLVLEIFSVDDQATAELRMGERETYELGDRDFLQPNSRGPTLRWSP